MPRYPHTIWATVISVTASHELYHCTTNWTPLFSSPLYWDSPGGKDLKLLLLSQEHWCLSECPLTPPAPRLKPTQKPFTRGTASEVSALHSANNAMSWTSPPLTPHFTHTSFSHIHMNTEAKRVYYFSEYKYLCKTQVNKRNNTLFLSFVPLPIRQKKEGRAG